MRRIEGAPMIPAGGGLMHGQIPVQRPRRRITNLCQNFQFRAKMIDVLSRVLFPTLFALFNIIYWSYYLTQESETGKSKKNG